MKICKLFVTAAKEVFILGSFWRLLTLVIEFGWIVFMGGHVVL